MDPDVERERERRRECERDERRKRQWRTVAPLENYLRSARAEVLRYRDTRAGTDTGSPARVCVFGPILHAISRWKALPAGWRGF